jgi:hypothetical protein
VPPPLRVFRLPPSTTGTGAKENIDQTNKRIINIVSPSQPARFMDRSLLLLLDIPITAQRQHFECDCVKMQVYFAKTLTELLPARDIINFNPND